MPRIEPVTMLMVDGINMNASHFANFKTVGEAVKAMEADSILSLHNKSKDWAASTYNLCREKMGMDIPMMATATVKKKTKK